MKLFKHLQLAVVILLLTDIASFDYKNCKSRKLTEGTCPRKKCILEKCASGTDGSSTCQKSNCPIRLASCGAKEKPCGGCAKEKPSCPPKESPRCPFCGQDMCPQNPPSGCTNQPPTCQGQKHKLAGPHPKPACRGRKSGCPHAKTKPAQRGHQSKCTQEEKMMGNPQRCSLFWNFPFTSVTNMKKGDAPKVEHKGKCTSRCPGGDACTGKHLK